MMSSDRKRMVALAVVMAAGCFIVALIIISVLYGVHMREARARLTGAVQSQTRLIEAISRFNAIHAPLIRDEIPTYDPLVATITQILDAYGQNCGLGRTGEFVFATKENDLIIFQSSHKQLLGEDRTAVPYVAERAEPMRRALDGASGVMVGLDYRGETVVAAYQPLPRLQMGLVAKIDLAEVRSPFIRAGVIAVLLVILVVACGAVLMAQISNPVIWRLASHAAQLQDEVDKRRRMELSLRENERTVRALLNAPTGIVALLDVRGTILDGNEELGRRLGQTLETLIGRCIWDAFLPQLTEAHRGRVDLTFRTGKVITYENMWEGCWNNITIHPILDSQGATTRVAIIIRDITQRKHAEAATAAALDELDQIFSTAPDAIRIINRDLTVIRANATFLALSGLSASEVEGRKCYETFAGPQCHTTNCPLQLIVEGADQVLTEITKTRTDGKSIPCMLSVTPFRDQRGNTIGIIEDCRDITDRKRAKEEWVRLSAIVEETSDLVSSADASGRIIYLNRAGRAMIGLEPADDVTGLKIADLHPQWAADVILREGIPAAKRNGGWHGETALYGQDRQELPVSQVIIVHQTDTGEVDYMSTIMRDISAQKVVELEREKLTAQLYQADKMATVGQLAAGVAHEINNPVGFVNSNLNTMNKYLARIAKYLDRDECGNQEERVALEGMIADFGDAITESLEGTGRIRKIVADLKGFSRADDNVMQAADINAGLESTLNMVWNQLKYHCKIEKELDKLPPVNCVINQLNQVFMNLLVNAGQAIHGDDGLINIKSWSDKHAVYVSVKDNGDGIPQENLKRIFDPFFTTKEVGTGTGLGLSLAFGIIKKHGGRIEVSSIVGEGTEFVIMLPRAGVVAEDTAGEKLSAACGTTGN